MGNTPAKPSSSSAGVSDEEIVFTVDSGALAPFGVYNIPQDYDQRVVKKFIVERKLAPFYKGLQDEPEGAESTTTGTTPVNHGVKFTVDRATSEAITVPQSSDNDLLHPGGSNAVPVTSTSAPPLSAQLSSSMPAPALHLAQSRTQLQASGAGGSVASPSNGTVQSFANSLKAKRSFSHASSSANLSKSFNNSTAASQLSKAGSTTSFQQHDVYENIPEEHLYKGAIECPICFLYYPRNINYTRCCDQPICTECFVQIKRPEATIDPAECPYCCQPHFGIVYYPLNANRTAHIHDHDDASSVALSESNGVDMSRRNSSFSHVEMFATSLGSSAGGASAGKSPLAAADDGEHAGTVSGSESLTRSEGKRRKSVPHKSPNVVTSDDIRPDWIRRQQQLVMQRAAQQRRMTMMEAALLARAHASDPARHHQHHREDGTMVSAAAALVESLTLGASHPNLSSTSLSSSNGHRSGNELTAPVGRRVRNTSANSAMSIGSVFGMGGGGGGGGLFGGPRAPVSYMEALRTMDDLEDLMIIEAMRRSLADESNQQANEGHSGSGQEGPPPELPPRE